MDYSIPPTNYKEFVEYNRDKNKLILGEDTTKSNLEKNAEVEAEQSGEEANSSVVDEAVGKKVISVEEYLAVVDALNKSVSSDASSKLWYRGMKSTTYDLLPSIMRDGLNVDLEIKYMSKFKSLANPYVENIPGIPSEQGPASYWEWLFYMQHYGVPTRIMDWTKDALVALLFACCSKNESEISQDAIVYTLNPSELNKAFRLYDYLPEGYIPNVQEEKVYEIYGPNPRYRDIKDKPIAVLGPLNSTKISAQKGVFTVFPSRKDALALNKFDDSSQYLYSIVIDKDACDSIVAQLANYGITEASLFPELSSIAQHIKNEGF